MKIKSVFICSLALSILASTAANADCRSAYQDRIKTLDGWLNPARATVITNVIGGSMIPLVLSASGATLTVASMLSAPALAVGAGTYFTVILAKKRAYMKALRLIQDAEAGDGVLIQRVLKKIQKDQPKTDKDDVKKAILDGNDSNLFCRANPIDGRVKLFGYKKLNRYIKAELENTNHAS